MIRYGIPRKAVHDFDALRVGLKIRFPVSWSMVMQQHCVYEVWWWS